MIDSATPIPCAPSGLDARSALREATADLHAQVDTVMPLARPAPSLDDYRRHLRILLAWTRRLPRQPELALRLESQATVLQSDLATCSRLLGEHRPSAQEEAASSPGPATHDACFGWGVAYVLEGSHLGGQVLYRELAGRLAPHPLDYLRGAGKATGARWTAFLAELRGRVRTASDITHACSGAVHAFDLLLDCHRQESTTA